MRIEKKHIIGIVLAVITAIVSIVFLRDTKIFYFVIGLAGVIAVLPFLISIIIDSRVEEENNEMFLEFARNLAESVKTGTPISRSIMNVRNKFYGPLTPHIQKLANQISLGIPVREALGTFAADVNNQAISRAINLISEAEKAGGEIEKILDSVSRSVAETEKLKKERKAAIYSLVVQGYIIFFIFIIIMMVLQLKILPLALDFGGASSSGASEMGVAFGSTNTCGPVDSAALTNTFLYLLVSQGFFAGLIIGKLAEGSIKKGLKHSFAMAVLAWLITTGVNAFFG